MRVSLCFRIEQYLLSSYWAFWRLVLGTGIWQASLRRSWVIKATGASVITVDAKYMCLLHTAVGIDEACRGCGDLHALANGRPWLRPILDTRVRRKRPFGGQCALNFGIDLHVELLQFLHSKCWQRRWLTYVLACRRW
jgi:hypothetical protein